MDEQRLPMAPHVRVGRTGEDTAARFLERKNYRIYGRNVRVGSHDEIDIVAFDPIDRVIVFCEVKTRTRADSEFLPEVNVNWKKRRNMARSARRWILEHAWEGGARLDIVCVSAGAVIGHYEDVEWPAPR